MRDVIRPYKAMNRPAQVWVTRGLMLGFLGIAFVLGMNPPPIMIDLVGYSTAGTAVLVPTMLGFQWKHRSKLGAFLSIIAGASVLGTLAVTGVKPFDMHQGFFGAVTAAITYLAIGVLKPMKKES